MQIEIMKRNVLSKQNKEFEFTELKAHNYFCQKCLIYNVDRSIQLYQLMRERTKSIGLCQLMTEGTKERWRNRRCIHFMLC